MLAEHERNPTASFAEGMESPTAAAAGANGADADDSSDDEAAAEAAEPQDPVDWDAPLAGSATATATAAAEPAPAPWQDEEGEGGAGAGAATGAAAAAFVGPAERQRLAAVAELGLRFADAAAEAGYEGERACSWNRQGHGDEEEARRGRVDLQRLSRSAAHSPAHPPFPARSFPALPGAADAARVALGVLVRSAHLLPPAQAELLVFRMGQCRMTESARSLAAAVAAARAPGSLSDPAVASLLAALVGGMHGPAVQGTLQAAGLAPLAAVYSAVWGTGDRGAALADWQRQLAAAHPETAAAVAITPPPA